jgi:hypothetical protein
MKPSILSLLLVASLVANGVQWQASKDQVDKVPYARGDKKIIDAAIRLWADEVGAATPSQAMKGRIAVAAGGDGLKCVNLLTERSLVGRVPFYCFDRTGRLIQRGSF